MALFLRRGALPEALPVLLTPLDATEGLPLLSILGEAAAELVAEEMEARLLLRPPLELFAVGEADMWEEAVWWWRG